MDYPENCTLVAVATGDGYMLAVEDENRQVVAELAWPESWPTIVTPAYLTVAGFKIVPA